MSWKSSLRKSATASLRAEDVPVVVIDLTRFHASGRACSTTALGFDLYTFLERSETQQDLDDHVGSVSHLQINFVSQRVFYDVSLDGKVRCQLKGLNF